MSIYNIENFYKIAIGWDFFYCSLYSCSSNFEIVLVVALNFFALFFLKVLYIGSWLLYCIVPHIVTSLHTIEAVNLDFSRKIKKERNSFRYRL